MHLSQERRLVKRSRTDLEAGDSGINVAIPIPRIDRGTGDPRNCIVVTVDNVEYELSKIAVEAGILCAKHSREQSSRCPQRLFNEVCINSVCTVTLR